MKHINADKERWKDVLTELDIEANISRGIWHCEDFGLMKRIENEQFYYAYCKAIEIVKSHMPKRGGK